MSLHSPFPFDVHVNRGRPMYSTVASNLLSGHRRTPLSPVPGNVLHSEAAAATQPLAEAGGKENKPPSGATSTSTQARPEPSDMAPPLKRHKTIVGFMEDSLLSQGGDVG